MNTNRNIEKACVHGEEIVSYLYDEMPSAGRMMFETHLLECVACTDEFAGLSLARLEVYEWNTYEFAAVPTPFIAIPYESSDRVSWFENWFGPVFSTPKWAAGGVLAVAAVVFGFVISPSVNMENNVSISEVKTIQTPAAVQGDTFIPTPIEKNQIVESKLPGVTDESDSKIVIAKSIKASPYSVRKSVIDSKLVAARAVLKTKNVRPLSTRNAPRLTNFEDENDNTLRLADLIADANTDQ